MTGQPRRIGLMGCGTVADYGHIPAIQRTDGLSLHAIYDPRADALERTKSRMAYRKRLPTPGCSLTPALRL